MLSLRSIWMRLRERATLPLLRRLVRWRPLENPQPGYTILLGCNAPLGKMLLANLAMLARQRHEHLRQIIVIFDRPQQQMPDDIEAIAAGSFPSLPLKFVYYTRMQQRIARATRSPWVFAWLSWSLGIQLTTTRYAFLHDFDALLINPTFLEDRFAAIGAGGAAYLGMQRYAWGEIPAELGYVQTFEMAFDAAFVRERFEPVDLFNRIHTIKGRAVVMDTFLHAQSLAGERVLIEAAETDLVHPGQMICQFQNLQLKRSYVPPGKNNLLLIPYFYFLGGITDVLGEVTAAIEAARQPSIAFFGRAMDLSRLEATHVDKITREANRLETAVAGEVRPPVQRYFAALAAFVQRFARQPRHAAQPAAV